MSHHVDLNTVNAPPYADQGQEVSPAQEPDILSIVDRLANNPDVNLDNLQRMLEMHGQVKREAAKRAFVSSFAALQADIPVIAHNKDVTVRYKDKKTGEYGPPRLQSRYATWESIWSQIKPIVIKHGFSLSFDIRSSQNVVEVTATLMHTEGHELRSDPFGVPFDNAGNKNTIQAYGSAVTYAKRYSACAMLNIVTNDKGEHDDDGYAAGLSEPISDEQRATIQKAIDQTGTDIEKFCQHFKIECLPDLPKSKFESAMTSFSVKMLSQGASQ